MNLYNEINWSLLPPEKRESIKRSKIFWKNATGTTLKFQASNGFSKSFDYKTDEWSFYSGRHNFSMNLGYSEEAVSSVTITFSGRGIYTFDSIFVSCLPMTDYETQIDALKEMPVEKLSMENDRISGEVSLDDDRLICAAIPYSTGWSAYVDGKEVKLHRANIQYMAFEAPEGSHKFTLIYKTPFLRTGAAVSGFTAVVCAVLTLRYEAKKRSKRQLYALHFPKNPL